MSNEHPDMHGNWLDTPFFCDRCGREMKEEQAWASQFEREADKMFCSESCAMDFDDDRGETQR